MSLGVYWDGTEIGRLERVDERSREYSFTYSTLERPISLSLPTDRSSFTPSESRPFFEGLLPEGAIREEIASQLRLAASDSYGLLEAIGWDCAGALQIITGEQLSEQAEVLWLDDEELDRLVEELPRRPLGMRAAEERLRLSLAGVQRKAVLVGNGHGRFGEPLGGIPSTHILKPEALDGEYPGLPVNEYFSMTLARRCGLEVANVELIVAARRPCLVVERFDRDRSKDPARRLHQEDLCQALGITPDFKYQQPGWRVPSYASLAELLDEHSLRPGVDRLAVGRAAIFNFLLANADGHARNFSLLHEHGGVRLAPLYDIVCTGAYPDLNPELALGIGDELDPRKIGAAQWSDLAYDLRLRPRAFEQLRADLAVAVRTQASALREQAKQEGWHHSTIDAVLMQIETRSKQLETALPLR